MDNKPSTETTMEEILASIRRNILQEPGKDPAPQSPAPNLNFPPVAPIAPLEPATAPIPPASVAPASPAAPDAAPADDILELTDMVAADGNIVSLRTPSQSVSLSAAALSSPAPARVETELVAHHVATAVVASISQLAVLKPQPVMEVRSVGDGLLVETLVRQSVEPMLKDWLDRNLPGIVEQAVRREVERIARKVELG